jgi:hypothetical protein
MPQLAPSPKFRAVGADGLALVGGKLWSYTEGTSTPKATYTSFTLGAANTNPVILDARGEADVWLDGSYKLVLTDDADVTIWTVDSIRDLTQNQTFTGATLAGTLTVSSTAVTWSGNPTHSGNHTFSGNVTVNGNTQLGNASSDTLRIDPNAVTWTNNPTHSGNHTFSGALALASGAVIPGTYTPTSSAKTNIDSDTWAVSYYGRIGDFIVGGGFVTINPTAATTLTLGTITLPVTTTVAAINQLVGGMTRTNASGGSGLTGTISGNAGAGTASFSFLNDADTASRDWNYWYMYRVI